MPERDRLLADADRACRLRTGVRAAWRRLWRKHVLRLSATAARVVKRSVDVAFSAAAIVVLSPLFACIAAAIYAGDHGPVLFWQRRVGLWGREFDFPKFRSMCLDAEARKAALLASNDHVEGVTFKMRADPRVTPVGRVLRRFSLDELPQLWCVLRGQMSLVGPRPPVPSEVALYSLSDRRRLDAVPGLTCLWQVAGRGEVPFSRQVEMDVDYIRRQSLGEDLRLMLRTIPAVLGGRGAY